MCIDVTPEQIELDHDYWTEGGGGDLADPNHAGEAKPLRAGRGDIQASPVGPASGWAGAVSNPPLVRESFTTLAP